MSFGWTVIEEPIGDFGVLWFGCNRGGPGVYLVSRGCAVIGDFPVACALALMEEPQGHILCSVVGCI